MKAKKATLILTTSGLRTGDMVNHNGATYKLTKLLYSGTPDSATLGADPAHETHWEALPLEPLNGVVFQSDGNVRAIAPGKPTRSAYVGLLFRGYISELTSKRVPGRVITKELGRSELADCTEIIFATELA